MTTDAPLVTTKPAGRGPALKEYQLDTIAKLSAMNANSPEMISQSTGIDLGKINRLLSGKNEKFNLIQQGYQEIVAKHHTGAMFDMIQKLPACSRAIDAALDSDDVRVARDTAFDIYDRVLPELNPRRSGQAGESGVHISVTNNNPQAAVLLNTTMDSVASMIGDLKEHLTLEGEMVGGHELLGEAALSRPPGQLEVGDGEALPQPGDSEEDWDLIQIREPTLDR